MDTEMLSFGGHIKMNCNSEVSIPVVSADKIY